MKETMVGYYHNSSSPNREMSSLTMANNGVPSLEATKPVKSLVCSPDLSAVFAAPGAEPLTNLNKVKPYQCLLCRKNFEQKSAYQSHLRSHGKEGEDPYRCNICGKTFAVPARLTRHYRTHTGEKPYKCEYCSKSFSVKENLSVHRRIHTKERPYKCDVCARAFEHSGKLHRHMRIHTGERPHKCSVCGKTFIQSGQLVIHTRTHTGEKPYVCNVCNKGFTCSKQLKVHTRTHTGEKPYTCDICGKSFGYNHVLKLHQVAHFGAKVYKCTLCHETFNSKKTMELHIKTHSDSGLNSPRDSSIEPMIEISHTEKVDTSDNSNAVTAVNSSNDKENSKTEVLYQMTSTAPTPASNFGQTRDLPYYLYARGEPQYPLPPNSPMGVVNPALLAAAAAAAAVEDRYFQPPVSPVSLTQSNETIFLYQEPSTPSYTNYGIQNLDNDCSSVLDLPGNDARRRVEAALEAVEEERQREYADRVERQPILTPPSSNPVSPAPSPDPLDLAIPLRETLILPPRKRCKAILESMESERTGIIAAQRQNSVIQFARASESR